MMSFITHLDYLGEDMAQQAYRMLLDRLSRVREAGRCWIALPAEARIAWAGSQADQLIYRVEPASPSDDGASVT